MHLSVEELLGSELRFSPRLNGEFQRIIATCFANIWRPVGAFTKRPCARSCFM